LRAVGTRLCTIGTRLRAAGGVISGSGYSAQFSYLSGESFGVLLSRGDALLVGFRKHFRGRSHSLDRVNTGFESLRGSEVLFIEAYLCCDQFTCLVSFSFSLHPETAQNRTRAGGLIPAEPVFISGLDFCVIGKGHDSHSSIW